MTNRFKFFIPILLILVILPMLATDIYLPAMPNMGLEFEANNSSLGDTLTSYMLGYSLSLLAAGVLSDIYGRRAILIIGLSIFAVSSMGCYLSQSIEQLIAWRFFQAFGGGCGTLIARIIVRDVFDLQSQVRILSLLAIGLVVSPIFGPILGAYISVYFGWRSTFLSLLLISIVALVTASIFLQETLSDDKRRKSLQIRHIFHECMVLLQHRGFVFNTLIISFAWAVYFSFLSSSSVLLQGLYFLTPIEYSYVLSVTISGFILGAIFIRRKISVLNKTYLIVIAAIVIFIATLALLFFASYGIFKLAILLPLVFLALLGVGIIFPATQAGVTESFKNNLGLISGLFYSTEMMFGAICAFILSRSDAVNWQTTSLIMFISSLFIVFICILHSSLVTNLFKSNSKFY
jgi:MFS transporter, DHA1 family, multidrug resistance protein